MIKEEILIEIANMEQEMHGLEQLGKHLSIHSGHMGEETDDIWFIVYELSNKWRTTLGKIQEIL